MPGLRRRPAVVEAVVKVLQRQSEILDIPPDRFGGFPFHQDALKEIRDGRHVIFHQAEPRDLDRADA